MVAVDWKKRMHAHPEFLSAPICSSVSLFICNAHLKFESLARKSWAAASQQDNSRLPFSPLFLHKVLSDSPGKGCWAQSHSSPFKPQTMANPKYKWPKYQNPIFSRTFQNSFELYNIIDVCWALHKGKIKVKLVDLVFLNGLFGFLPSTLSCISPCFSFLTIQFLFFTTASIRNMSTNCLTEGTRLPGLQQILYLP